MAQVVGHASTRDWVMSVSETYSTILRDITSSKWFTPNPSLVSRCVECIQIHWPTYEVDFPSPALVAHNDAWWMIASPSIGSMKINIKRTIDRWRSAVGPWLVISFHNPLTTVPSEAAR
jgi:hypothetical protein